MSEIEPRNGSTRRWRVLRQVVIDEEDVCWLCDQPVDKTLEHPNPMQASVDHVVGLAQGGEEFDRANLRLSHMACNIKKAHSDRIREAAGDREKPRVGTLPQARLAEAMTSGTYREQLEALRDVLAAQVAEATPRDMAPLTNQLAKTIKTLSELPDAAEEDPVARTRRAAAARRAAAKGHLEAV